MNAAPPTAASMASSASRKIRIGDAGTTLLQYMQEGREFGRRQVVVAQASALAVAGVRVPADGHVPGRVGEGPGCLGTVHQPLDIPRVRWRRRTTGTRVACRNNVSPAAAPRRAGGGRGHPRHRAVGLAGCRGARRRALSGLTVVALGRPGRVSAPSRGSPSAALTGAGDRRHRSQVSEPVGGASSSASARFSAPRRSRPSIHESRWERSRSTRASAIDTL